MCGEETLPSLCFTADLDCINYMTNEEEPVQNEGIRRARQARGERPQPGVRSPRSGGQVLDRRRDEEDKTKEMKHYGNIFISLTDKCLIFFSNLSKA